VRVGLEAATDGTSGPTPRSTVNKMTAKTDAKNDGVVHAVTADYRALGQAEIIPTNGSWDEEQRRTTLEYDDITCSCGSRFGSRREAIEHILEVQE